MPNSWMFVLFPDTRKEGPSILLVLKWGGELTPAGRVQAEELGRAFRCMYPGGQGRPLPSTLLILPVDCNLFLFVSCKDIDVHHWMRCYFTL